MAPSLHHLLPFSAIIFDCDGTLVDTVPAHLAALQQAVQMRGYRMDADWYYQRHSITADELLLEFERDGLGELPDKAAVLADHQRLLLYNMHLMREVQVVTAIVRTWHGRVPMGVASNGHRFNVEATLKAVRLDHMFDTVVTREDVVHGKPEPDIYLEAARRLGVSPESCVVLEDADTGILAAEAAGARVVDVRHWHTPLWHADLRRA